MTKYVTDDLMMEVRNSSRAYNVFSKAEFDERNSAIFLKKIPDILGNIEVGLSLEQELHYAIAQSKRPFMVMRLTSGEFVVVISEIHVYCLHKLCVKLQGLPPLSDFLNTPKFSVAADLTGQTLVNIAGYLITDGREPPPTPIDETVTEFSLSYILAHEVAHIAHGHLEFKKSPEYLSQIENPEDRRITDLTLEMDADSCAASVGISYAIGWIEHEIAHCTNIQLINIEAYKYGGISRLILSYLCALVFMDYCQAATSNANQNITHPLTYYRYVITKQVMNRYFSEIIERDDYCLIHQEVRERLVAAFSKLSGSIESLGHPLATNGEIITVSETDTTTEYFYDYEIENYVANDLQRLHARWARIRPTLETYKIGGRLAPASTDPA